jgi:hypothetical protein
MEPPRRAVTLERALAAALLCAALGAARLESGSALAARAQDGRPWLAWLESRERGHVAPPSFILVVYDPVARRLSLMHVPNDLKLEKRRTLERAYLEALKATKDLDAAARAAEDLAEARLRELSPEPIPQITGRLAVETGTLSAEDEVSVEAAAELKARSGRLRTWLSLLRRAGRGPALDPLLFALEVRRAPANRIEPARLPDEASAAASLGRLFAAERDEDPRPSVAEVLNGAGAPGLATRVAKMLRLKGVDVLTTGSVKPRARTLVYDRIGDFRRATRALAMLGCPSARAVTRADASRAVDVSVQLGDDCAATFGPGSAREP